MAVLEAIVAEVVVAAADMEVMEGTVVMVEVADVVEVMQAAVAAEEEVEDTVVVLKIEANLFNDFFV